MASFFNIASRFTRQPAKPAALNTNTTNTDQRQPSPSSALPPSPGPLQTSLAPGSSGASPSSANPPSNSMAEPNSPSASQSRKLPFCFREENTNLVVKGNFMTLADKPIHVEKGEWLAHQVVEQYRLLELMLKVIQEVDTKSNMPICNSVTCPNMTTFEYVPSPTLKKDWAFSNGISTIYTWLDNAGNPKPIPAHQYITLVSKWINGKLRDPKLFPQDESTPYYGVENAQNGQDWLGKMSGFPENFEYTVRNLYRQMFRCYAHIYFSHWLEPFYNISAYKELNTSFVHFINVGRLWGILSERDMKPMQPLIDIWINKGLIPSPDQQGGTPAQAQTQAPASAQTQPKPSAEAAA